MSDTIATADISGRLRNELRRLGIPSDQLIETVRLTPEQRATMSEITRKELGALTRSKGNGNINVSFGELASLIRDRAAAEQTTAAELIRRAVAAYLGQPAPVLERGNPAFRKAGEK